MPSLQFKGKSFVQNYHLAVPFHELIPIKEKSLTDKPSLTDNLIIHGDNLKALKSLLPLYAGKVKCIYIDPPYNTGNEKWVYNDNVNSPMMQEWLGKVVDREDLTRHDKWLCMMTPRLKLLREMMTDDGVIFISIDDTEVHHLRDLMDEIFGEENFIATIVWEKVYSPKSSAKFFSENHDFIVAYARNKQTFELGMLPRTEEANARYENPDDDPRGDWKPSDLSARNPYSKGRYKIKCPGGRTVEGPPQGAYWRVSKEKFEQLDKDRRIWWGSDKNQIPAIKRFLNEVRQGLVPETIWTYKEVGHTQDAKKTLKDIFGDDFEVFNTPKPVELLKRIIKLSTNESDLILDAFAGSATTAQAVLELNDKSEAERNRNFICIESEEYAYSITAERVRRVINGVKGSKNEGLKKGFGGSFTFCELGEPMDEQRLLAGKTLPTFEELARYVFYVSTGEEFKPEAIDKSTGFIGESSRYHVYLFYEPKTEILRNLALDSDKAEKMKPLKGGKKRLVFAPTKYLDQEYLDKYKIDFAQLPYQIYQRAK